MTTLAKDAILRRTGSHYIYDDRGWQASGIDKEEVFLYFSAQWRGQPVIVTMQADRYSASVYNSATNTSKNRLTDWRTYATEARYEDPEKSGGRGEYVTGTARSALSKLCEPLVTEWLASDAYEASFQAAVAYMILRKFRDDYSAQRNVTEALAVFKDRLPRTVFLALNEALDFRKAYDAAIERVSEVIEEEGQS